MATIRRWRRGRWQGELRNEMQIDTDWQGSAIVLEPVPPPRLPLANKTRKLSHASDYTPPRMAMVRRPHGQRVRTHAGATAQPELPISQFIEEPVAQPTLETHVYVPMPLGAAVGAVLGGIAWYYLGEGPGLVVGGLSFLTATWIRVGVSDAVLRRIEEYTGLDLDGDGHVGEPADNLREIPIKQDGQVINTIYAPERGSDVREESWRSFALAVLRDGCRISQNAICAHTKQAAGLVKVSQPQYLLMYNDLRGRGMLDDGNNLTVGGAQYLWYRLPGAERNQTPFPQRKEAGGSTPVST